MRRLAVLLVSAAAVSAALVLSAGGSAQAPDGRTLTFYEDAGHETGRLIDEAPKSPAQPGSKRFRLSVGDRLVRTTPILDKKGGKRIGTEYTDVAIVRGDGFEDATYLGHAVIKLHDGQIVAAVAFKPAKTNTFAVIGGTGAYEGARGTATEVDQGNGGRVTAHLLP